MSTDCCAPDGNVMLLPCSGGSNTGQMANQAAVELTREGFGKMYCLAGIGGRLSGFVQSARDVDRLIVIDGCEIACGQATLESAGVTVKKHLVVTELGLEKNKDFTLKSEDISTVKEAVRCAFRYPIKASFAPQQSPSALPRMGGGGGKCCCG